MFYHSLFDVSSSLSDQITVIFSSLTINNSVRQSPLNLFVTRGQKHYSSTFVWSLRFFGHSYTAFDLDKGIIQYSFVFDLHFLNHFFFASLRGKRDLWLYDSIIVRRSCWYRNWFLWENTLVRQCATSILFMCGGENSIRVYFQSSGRKVEVCYLLCSKRRSSINCCHQRPKLVVVLSGWFRVNCKIHVPVYRRLQLGLIQFTLIYGNIIIILLKPVKL